MRVPAAACLESSPHRAIDLLMTIALIHRRYRTMAAMLWQNQYHLYNDAVFG